MDKLMIKYDGEWVPRELCTIDRDGGADDCEICSAICRHIGKTGELCCECPIQKVYNQLAAYEEACNNEKVSKPNKDELWELEKALEEYMDNAFHRSLKPNISEEAKMVSMVALREKLEREKSNGWIKCNERLPDDCRNVLTCDDFGNIHIMSHSNYFTIPFNIEENNLRYYPVKYWMEIPKPPNEVRGMKDV